MSIAAAPLSLRGRLLLAVVCLTATGLLVAGVLTYTALRSFLLERVDDQLGVTAQAALQEFRHAGDPVPDGEMTAFPHGTVAELRRESGAGQAFRITESPDTDPEELIDLPADLGLPAGQVERRFTVAAAGVHPSYRVSVTAPTPTELLIVGVPQSDATATLNRLVVVQGVVYLAVLVLLAALARWSLTVGLRPLRRIETTAAAIAAGDLSQRVAPGHEGTEVGRLSAALNTMLAQIEQAFADRTAAEDRLRGFVADASHELRTPLTSIRGYAELFRRGASTRPADLATVLRRVEEEATRMGVLVDDLLLLAQLDEDRPLHPAAVELSQVAADAVSDARVAAPDHRIDLDVDGQVVVSGDRDRLLQVVANLLVNARVHTPPGTHVRVSVRRDGDVAVVEVADEGPGMAEDAARQVFERFYRTAASRSRGRGGSGLGLAIVRAIVESHGGRVRLRTASGRGATFRIELPAAPSADALALPADAVHG